MAREFDEKLSRAIEPRSGVEEDSIFTLIGETFRGRQRWLTIYGVVVGIVFTALAILCAVKLFQAEELRAMLLWAMGLVVALLTVSLMKIWFWIQLHSYAVLRELKRLELRVAKLGERVGN